MVLLLFISSPPHVQYNFSIESLVGVLKRAMQKRKYIRDEKTQDKLDLRKEESSRSNSQASDAPSKPVLPQQSSTGWLELSYCNKRRRLLEMNSFIDRSRTLRK